MLNLKFFTYIIFMVLAHSVFSQSVYLKGTVIDSFKNPMAGLKVQALKEKVVTDSYGKFDILMTKNSQLTITSYNRNVFRFLITDTNFKTFVLPPQKADILEEVNILGSRSSYKRNNIISPIPLEKLSIKELEITAQNDVAQMLQYVLPSFNANKTAVNGSSNYASPASLKGLPPDQTLVLIEGKRRHQFSGLNNNFVFGRGSVPTDLSAIPAIALENIEVLKDGAAAQYGSDAIAGIINLRLKKTVHKLTLQYQTSITQQGDGFKNSLGLNYGIKLGKYQGFWNFSAFIINAQYTNRADNYSGNIYSLNKVKEDSIRLAKVVYPVTNSFRVNIYGDNGSKAYQLFSNLRAYFNKNTYFYSFGGYSNNNITSFGFFRNAIPSDAGSNTDIYPNGYLIETPGNTSDASLVIGIFSNVAQNWKFDLSTSYGGNTLKLFTDNNTNPSLGKNSPTNFYIGSFQFQQITTELNISKFFKRLIGIQNFSMAYGVQHRVELFNVYHGDSTSYIAGPLAFAPQFPPKNIGAVGRTGIAPNNESNAIRTNLGVYADFEGDILPHWNFIFALRNEYYSDFGYNFSLKLASLYQIKDWISIRASFDKGFRAPSLQQIYNNQTTTINISGQLYLNENLRSNDLRLAEVGIKPPQPEISYNFNIGSTLQFGKNIYSSIDFYNIDIYDRIVISENVFVSKIPALQKVFGPTFQQQISFITNQINTNTQGIDFLFNYLLPISLTKTIKFNFVYSYNQTKVTHINAPPPELTVGLNPNQKISLFDTISIGLIENAQPQDKCIVSVGFASKKFSIDLRASYFGAVKTNEKNINMSILQQNYRGKIITDLNFQYKISVKTKIGWGINNVFDIYPDKSIPNSPGYFSGQFPYTRSATQFGFTGRFFFANFTLTI
ncbi:MAG: TonB-dependent receptor [Alphaproteobacteria bacterium]|nr:TonB-dependent receptor [Alphaproteobacteria bacterium]